MGLSIVKMVKTNPRVPLENNVEWRYCEVTCDISYPTGGYGFSARHYSPFEPHALFCMPYGAYFAEYDYVTQKLLVYKGGNEVTDGTDISDIFFTVMMLRFVGTTRKTLEPTLRIQEGVGVPTQNNQTPVPPTDVNDGDTTIVIEYTNRAFLEYTINNSSPTTITAITGGVAGQYIGLNIEDNGNTIIQDNNQIRLRDKHNFRGYTGARIWLYNDGSYYREM